MDFILLAKEIYITLSAENGRGVLLDLNYSYNPCDTNGVFFVCQSREWHIDSTSSLDPSKTL